MSEKGDLAYDLCQVYRRRLEVLESRTREIDGVFQAMSRLHTRITDLEYAVRGEPDRAGLMEKVEAILRFLGGTIVVRPQRREVVVEKESPQ